MSEEKKNSKSLKVGGENLEQKEISISENAGFPNGIGEADVELIGTEENPYHQTGKKFKAHKTVADRLVERGWAKLAGIIFVLMSFAFSANAQADMLNLLGSNIKSDSAVNAGTAILSLRVPGGLRTSTTIIPVISRVTGTVAGTVSVSGSLDGTNFVSASATTFTATNVATQATGWTFPGNPYLFYRVTYVGSGTMLATISAKLLSH